MAGSLTGTDSWFGDPVAKVSAHFGIGKAGQVHQYVRVADTAYHAGVIDIQPGNVLPSILHGKGNPNHWAIGIEHEGELSDDWTDEMVEASAKLLAWIAVTYTIVLDRDHILTHHQIKNSKPCPGPKAPIDQIIARAIQITQGQLT